MAQQSAVSPEDHVSQPSAPGSGEGSIDKGSGQDDGREPLPAGMQQQRAALNGCSDLCVSNDNIDEAETPYG